MGQWLDGVRHGQGTFTAPSPGGDVYSGDWLNDLKHGNGTFKSANGTYEGQYQLGKMGGSGLRCGETMSWLRKWLWIRSRMMGVMMSMLLYIFTSEASGDVCLCSCILVYFIFYN